MSPRWRWFLPGYVWALPGTIVGLLLAVLVYRCHSWGWRSGCLEAMGGRKTIKGEGVTRIWGRPGAQTHGWLILYADDDDRQDRELRAHERVHVVQGFIGGPLFMLAYGANFVVLALQHAATLKGMSRWAALKQSFVGKDWKISYWKIWFEVRARAVESRPGAWS